MPRLLLLLVTWLVSRVESSRFSIRPAPKTGVGILNMMLFSATAVEKLGWGSAVLFVQVPASERPVTVNSVSTPPLGELVFTLPLALKKNGKRASRVGPLAVMKDGIVLPGATPLLVNWN